MYNYKEYYIRNKERLNRKQAERWAATPEEKKKEAWKKYYNSGGKEKEQLYYLENKEKRNKQQREWFNSLTPEQKSKMWQGWIGRPAVRVGYNLRSRIRWLIKVGLNKDDLQKITGCSFEELKVYLEGLFTEGMSWDNYGKGGWEIDHKIPCSKFNLLLEEEQKKCFHYTNLQPMWGWDNRKKGNKLPNETFQRLEG